MNNLGKSLVLVLVVLAITQSNLAKAQPSTVDTGININSPKYIPYQNEQYENTTATLNIKVTLVYGQYNQSWIDTVHLDSVCYSLDGQPLVYIDKFAVENYTDYGTNQQHFLLYTTSIKLENLSEGSHTVAAYANDTHNKYAYLNNISSKYSFIVNTNDSSSSPTSTSTIPTTNTGPHVPETEPFLTSVLVVALILLAVVIASFLLFRRHRKTCSVSK